MNRRQIALKLTMDELGLPLRMEEFDDRLIVQKAVYLCQAAGAEMGYYYNWYLKGPYCSALADDAFCVVAETEAGATDPEGWQLDGASKAKLNAVRDLLGENTRGDLAKHLELLASVHFLVASGQASQKDVPQLRQMLERYGKHYDLPQIEGAIAELSAANLL